MATGSRWDEPLRRLAAASGPQHLLLTLIADYWYPRSDAIPSGALVDLLAAFGVSATNSRAALSRTSRRGLLVGGRKGRHTTYALSASAIDTLHEGTRRIFTFGERGHAWDGRWTLVVFSIPEESRATRSALRVRLGWAGFAPLFDGVWVAPGSRERAAADLVRELDVDLATVMVGEASELITNGSPIRAWDLRTLRGRYDSFIECFEPFVGHVESGALSGPAALLVRTVVVDAWREFPGLDPELPEQLLPTDWPLARAHALFARIYDATGPAAEAHVRSVVTAHDPDAAAAVVHHARLDIPAGPNSRHGH